MGDNSYPCFKGQANEPPSLHPSLLSPLIAAIELHSFDSCPLTQVTLEHSAFRVARYSRLLRVQFALEATPFRLSLAQATKTTTSTEPQITHTATTTAPALNLCLPRTTLRQQT